ncbi:MAG: hypothetical protein ABJP79_01095 [Tateyamaria sp.]|uniref:hypothetical protein n=1 Tax=Tateyamaria sp. TaxID=1929288 RepID=UPI00329F1BAB
MPQTNGRIPQTDDLLDEFLKFDALGLKKEAKQIVLAIIDTVPSLDAKTVWTQNNLDRLPLNCSSQIRHEIYESIVFPVLKAEFSRDEPDASYLLGKHWQNLVTMRSLSEQMDHRSATDFFRIAFELEPSSVRYRHAYLTSLINDLDFTFHEWPTGILIDHTNWQEDMQRLKEKLSLADSLDKDGRFSADLAVWVEASQQYETRLAEQRRS